MFNCSMCVFHSPTKVSLVQHFVRWHKNDPQFTARCIFNGCGVQYNSWSSYKSHVYRKHRDDVFEEQIDVGLGLAVNEPIRPVNDFGIDLHDPVDGVPDEIQRIHDADLPEEVRMQWNVAMFVLKLKESSNLSQNATSKIINGTKDLLEGSLTCIKDRLLRAAEETGSLTTDEISEVFDQHNATEVTTFVKTKFSMDKFLTSHGYLIMPEKIVINEVWTWVNKPKKHLILKPVDFYNIPFLSVLEQLLNQEDVLFCVNNPTPYRRNGIIQDFSDGNYVQNHPVFSRYPNALMIVIYYDDVEVVNPLGSKTKTHKVGIFYWSLGNIHPKHRSTLRAINLLAVVKTSYIRTYGVKPVLSKFIKDIQDLENGRIFRINGQNVEMHGSLLLFAGDTLASNYVGGFKEGVALANKPCRSCLGTHESTKRSFIEEDFILRDSVTHLAQCEDVLTPNITKEAKVFWSRHHGINDKSVLCDIESFDVTKCLVHDLMHVVIEGPLEIECRLFIEYSIDSGYFDLATFNKRWTNFNYGHLSKDKPTLIDRNHLNNKLRQNCAQLITLANVLPFLVYNKVPEDDTRLLNLICLLQILNSLMAFQFKEEDILLLKVMIEEHGNSFTELYPNASITPKMHFMVHMPRHIQEFGPSRHQWCMRFEAAHSRLKPLAATMKNFKNIPFSLAYRFQSLRASQLFRLPNSQCVRYLYQGDDVRPGLSIKVCDHTFGDLIKNEVDIENCTTTVLSSKQVVVHGTAYKKGSVILIEDDENNLPQFGVVEEIIVYETKKCLLYKELISLKYEKCVNAYEVEFSNTFRVKKIADLLHPFTLSLFKPEPTRRQFVILLCSTRNEFL